jgi:serine/threonine-protein kinase RsbW
MPSEMPSGTSVSIQGRTTAAERVFKRILAGLKANCFSTEDIFAVHLGMEEAFINAVRHGNKSNPNKKVVITFDIKPDQAEICLQDQGEGFDPNSIPDPTSPDNIFKIGGRGLFLIRSYVDVTTFNEKGNRICMVKYNSNSCESSPKKRAAK